MSILFSIIRLIPHMMRMRSWAYIAAGLFGTMWAALIILKVSVCETDTAWKHLPGVQCVLGPAVGGIELASASPTSSLRELLLTRLASTLVSCKQRTSSPTSSSLHCQYGCFGTSAFLHRAEHSLPASSLRACSPLLSVSFMVSTSSAITATRRVSGPMSWCVSCLSYN